MQGTLRWIWVGVALLSISACGARKQPTAEIEDRFEALLIEARTKDAADGFMAAMPAYLEAIASEPASERSDLLRYQMALRAHELGRDAEALDFISPLLQRDASHPLAGPLKMELLGTDAEWVDEDDSEGVSDAVTAPTAVTRAPVVSARQQRLNEIVGGTAMVRILLPSDGLDWPITFSRGAWDGEKLVYRPGWSGTLRQVRQAGWKRLDGPDAQGLPMQVRNWQGVGRLSRSTKGIVIHVPLEDYLIGVVGTEMSPSWHVQALRAQAVASRTYLVYILFQGRANSDYDLRGDVMDQAFRPESGQHSVATAVRETSGEILLWEDHPARIFFHADNGGISEDPRFVWGFKLPYYKIQNDAFSNRVDPWQARVPIEEIRKRMKLPAPAKITVNRDPSTRVTRLLWADSAGKIHTVKGNDFRLAVGPRRVRSLLFDVEMKGNELVFSGRGYGHGVGMSQWGAKTMAEQNMDYREILAYYYPGTKLQAFGKQAMLNMGVYHGR